MAPGDGIEVPFRADTVTWSRHAQRRPRRAGKGEGGAFKLADGGGLYPYLTPASAKSWRYDYRFNRRRRTLAFGLYPALSLAAARGRHYQARRLLAAGVDPAAKKKQDTGDIITTKRNIG